MAVGEWDRRELCPDGACTGLIGPEGTCKVCGHAAPNWGEPRKRGLEDEADEDVDDDEDDDEYEDEEEDPIAPSAKAEIGEWKERQLCSDGSCVGVIGADGKCKVCGKPAEGAAASGDDDEDEFDDDEDDGEDDGDEDEVEEDDDDELAAAADELAGVASSSEVEAAKDLATSAGDPEDERKLCPDGACIGVIGDNGKCKVCGKAAA